MKETAAALNLILLGMVRKLSRFPGGSGPVVDIPGGNDVRGGV